MKILLSGNPIDVANLSHLLKEYEDIELVVIKRKKSSIFSDILKFMKSNTVHHISAELTMVRGIVWLCIFTVLKMMRKKIILHWIGTDVLIADPRILERIVPLVDLHLANAPWLVDELKTKGVKSTCVILPTIVTHINSTPLPKDFTVLVYLGWDNPKAIDFYGGNIIKELIKSTPYRYIIMGGVKFEDLPNVEYINIVNHNEMEKIYARSTVLLRLTKHDGLSHMVQESLSMGRYVIWSQKYPACVYGDNYFSVIAHLKCLESKKEPNLEGIKYFENELNNDVLLKRLVETYREISNDR